MRAGDEGRAGALGFKLASRPVQAICRAKSLRVGRDAVGFVPEPIGDFVGCFDAVLERIGPAGVIARVGSRGRRKPGVANRLPRGIPRLARGC